MADPQAHRVDRRQSWRRILSLDLRALAALRIGLGLLVAIDALDRLRFAAAHYSDLGVLPRDALTGPSWRFSLHTLSGTPSWPFFLGILTVTAGLALALGWRTRTLTLVCWLLVCSVQARNPLVVYGADVLLRLLLFWALFLPLGALLSLDRRRGRAPRQTSARVLSGGTVGLTLQIALVYLVTFGHKQGTLWWTGEAGYYALQLDHFATPLGRALLAWPQALRALSFGVLCLEGVGPWLLLVPCGFGPLRTALVFAFVGFHLGLAAVMEIGWFPWISALAWIALLPAWFWDRAGWTPGRSSWQAPGAAPRRRARWPHAVAGVAAVVVLWWNLGNLFGGRFEFPDRWRIPVRLLRLDQKWRMFAPNPTTIDGWFVAEGMRADGAAIDLLRSGAPRRWNKPALVSATYPNQRWRKYLRNLWKWKHRHYRTPYARWLCDSWNASRPGVGGITQVSLYFMEEVTPPPGQPLPAPRKMLLRQYPCRPAAAVAATATLCHDRPSRPDTSPTDLINPRDSLPRCSPKASRIGSWRARRRCGVLADRPR